MSTNKFQNLKLLFGSKSRSMEKSPLESFLNVLPNLQIPQGHNKPLRHAFYNSIALLILCVGCATLWAVFRILDPFLKPLLWALLMGSVLHPFKYYLSQKIRNWFNKLQHEQTPLAVGFLMLPINAINGVSDFIGHKFVNYVKMTLWLSISLISIHLLYFYSPMIFIDGLSNSLNAANISVLFFINYLNNYIILSCLISYVISIVVYWKTDSYFKYGSYLLWFLCSLFVANLFDVAKVPIFIILQFFYLIGFLIQLSEFQKSISQSENRSIGITDLVKYSKMSCSEFENELKLSRHNPETSHDEDLLKKSQLMSPISSPSIDRLSISNPSIDRLKSFSTDQTQLRTLKYRHSLSSLFQLTANSLAVRNYLKACNSTKYNEDSKLDENNVSFSSDFYLYSIFWAFGITLVWKNILLLALVPIFIVLYAFKRIGHYFGVWELLKLQFIAFKDCLIQWFQTRKDAFVSLPLVGLQRLIVDGSDWCLACLIDSIDMISTAIVIICLVVFFVVALVFMSLQVYSEGITLIQISSNVFNKSVIHNPNLNQFLPPNLDETFDSIFDNAYVYGREGISKFVKIHFNGTEQNKLDKIESQLLDLWDRIYQTWLSSGDNEIGPKVDSKAIFLSWEAFIKDVRKSPEIFNLNALMEFLKQNLGTLMSFIQSLLLLLRGNLTLILSSFTAFLSIVFGGSTVVLNFIINTVVFVTTLFYLLSSSNRLYKPVDFITKLSPYYGNRFGLALEGAVNDVFNATFKMSLFYGLWTWIIHNLFSVKIVFIPSVLAAILGAVPFLGTYWACIPAVFDLWLAQDCSLKAILFAICQIAPTYVVDTTIYKEIKGGGHPYLTGLAIAGGIFCLGAEGAIFGPLLLCGLYVALNLSTDLIREPSTVQ